MARLSGPEIKWVKPEVPKTAAMTRKAVTAKKAGGAARAAKKVQPDPLIRMIQELGEPMPPVPMSPRDEAVFFLQVAAEVEHAFIVEYLYAAYSLDESPGDPVADWQGRILQIAKEEMGHLITVQNLLLLLGSAIYLNREEYPRHKDLYPFPLLLEPLSKASLDKYITAESPFDANKPVSQIHHVGVIYAKIYWLFQKSDQPQGPYKLPKDIPFTHGHHVRDSDLLPANQNTLQTKPEEWFASGDIHVDPTTARDKALNAISVIARQGEGLQPEDNSHYERFVQIRKEIDEYLQAGHSAFARDIATNPTTSTRPGVPKGSQITNPQTTLWLRLFNCRYQMLLLDIALAMSFTSSEQLDGEPARTKLAQEWAVFGEMTGALSNLARLLMKLPKDNTPGGPGIPRFAGPQFRLPVDPFPVDALGRWLRYRHLLETTASLISQVTPADAEQTGILESLKNTDQDRLTFVQKRIDSINEV